MTWTKINWAYVCHKLGMQEESRDILEATLIESEKALEKGYFWSNLDLARIYAFRNNKEKSLKYLREYENILFMRGEHDYILIDPLFENLRNDPDFLEIVHRVQAEKAELRAQLDALEAEGLLDM